MKRNERTKRLDLPSLLLLLIPTILFYSIQQKQFATIAFFGSAAYVVNYLMRKHLGVPVIRPSNNDMSHLSDGSMVVRFPVHLDKVTRYLQQKRDEAGFDINFNHLTVKSVGTALNDYPQVHGHVVFGSFFHARTSGVDVSMTVDISENESGSVKIVDANLKPVDYIADELVKRTEALSTGPVLTQSRKARLLALLPNAVRRYVELFFCFLGSQLGMTIPALGVVGYPLGAATVITSMLRENADVDTDMTMIPITTFSTSVPITVAIGGVRILPSLSTEGILSGSPVITICVTMDAKCGSVVEMRRFCNLLQQYMNNPMLLDKADRKLAVEKEDKRIAAERAVKAANKFKPSK